MRLASLVLLTAISRGAVSDADVQRIHSAAILIDTHNDVPMKMLRGYDIAQPSPRGSTDLARLRAGGVDAVFFAAYVPKKYAATKGASADYCRRVMKAIRTTSRSILAPCVRRHIAEIVAAAKQGKIAALIGIEGDMRSRTASTSSASSTVRGALHDPDAFEHQQLGRLLGR